jgi:hypothetical protein
MFKISQAGPQRDDRRCFEESAPARGENRMEDQIMAHTETAGRPVKKTIAYGLATVALYAGVFSYADVLAARFAQGALWAAGPIATVFVFSWAHGSFASNLWACLGITAGARAVKRPAVQPAVRPQVRATLNA